MKHFLPFAVLLFSLVQGVRGQAIDPIKFTLETNASRVQIGEEMEIVIKASLHKLPSNTVFVFKENYSFRIKLVTPEGFVQTSGTYSDYIGTTLSPAKPIATYTVKGKFTTSTKVNQFTLLRGNQNANDHSQFAFATSLSYAIHENENAARTVQENSTLVLSTPEFVKHFTIDELRNNTGDTARVVLVTNNGRVYPFRYDPNNTSSADNAATVIKNGELRYVIDADFITPEMFGAKGDGVTDDHAALQACLDVPNARYMFRKDAIYAVSNEVLIKNSNSQIIGNNATIKARSFVHPNPSIAFIMRTNNHESIHSNTATAINIKDGSADFTYDNPSALHVGDIVRIEGDTSYFDPQFNQIYNYGHMSQVKSKSGNVITLTNPAIETFTGSKLYVYRSLDRIEISDLNFDHGNTSVFGSLRLEFCTNSKVDGGSYRGNGLGQLGVLIDANINALVQRLDIDGYSNLVGTSPIGYGIGMIGHNVTAFKNRISDCKHALATSDRRYMSTGLIMDSNICYGLKVLGNTAPLDYHANARGRAINNTIYSFNAIGAQFRDGGIDVIDNTIIINNEGSEALTYKGLIFYEKYFGANRIEGNKIFFHHTTNPLGTFALQIDVTVADKRGVKNKNVTVRKNFFSEGFMLWKESDGGLVIEENEFTSPGDLGGALISPGIQILKSSDFLIRRNTFTNKHVSLGSYAVIIDDSCTRGTFRDNKLHLVNSDTDPQIRVVGKEMKIIDNVIISGAATQNSYISGYSTASKALLINNKKVTPTGSYVYIGYGILPNPDGFYVDQSIVVSAGSTTTSYTCKNVGGVYSWVLTENLNFTDPATAIPTKTSLNATYGAYKAGATVYFPNRSGAKRYVKLSDSSTSEWDEVTPTLVGP